jgi:hypothetical protein
VTVPTTPERGANRSEAASPIADIARAKANCDAGASSVSTPFVDADVWR